jgi:hypothetical protein
MKFDTPGTYGEKREQFCSSLARTRACMQTRALARIGAPEADPNAVVVISVSAAV